MAAPTRISLVKEDRIWTLRSHGYCYDSIARIVNVAPSSMTSVLRRVRRRPPEHVDPVRRGRRRSWMSDSQIADIRSRRAAGETLHSIARSYYVEISTIWSICAGRTYATPEGGTPYPFTFENRLVA